MRCLRIIVLGNLLISEKIALSIESVIKTSPVTQIIALGLPDQIDAAMDRYSSNKK